VDELQIGLETAGTGIGVVFAALVSLAVVTTLLGRLFRERQDAPEAATAAPVATPDAEPASTDAPDEGRVDPMMVAAMAAAVRFVRRGLGSSSRSAPRRQQSSEAPGAWRTQGRQSLMASQGNRVRPRNSRN
jgi:Na+-transporting methylmalonyl-CoA/oxaloacetate decarboxylase gamma subunit